MLSVVVFAAGFGLAVISIVFGSYHGICAARHLSPERPHRMLVDLNPLQAGWFKDQLDAAGLAHRRLAFKWMLFSIVVFLSSIAIAKLIS